MNNELTRHNQRTELLETIAILSGFNSLGLTQLPDGKRPDVFRMVPASGAVFIGEAKDCERPNNKETVRRLRGYMSWFKIISERNVGSIFAVCFGNENDAPEWAQTVTCLAEKVGLHNFRLEFTELGPADYLMAILPTKDFA